MRVLVTGVSGQIGSVVARELIAHEHSVLGVDNRALPADLRGSIEIQYLDIAEPLSMLTVAAGCDAILHLAAYPTPSRVTSAELLRVNVIGTQNILDSAAANGIGRVVLTSSVGALGFSFPTHPCFPDYLPVDAAHPRRPQDIYGVSKLMNEESAQAITRLTDLTTIVIRPPEVMNIARAAERGWLPRWTERNLDYRHPSLWSYIDELDLAHAYRLALEAPLTGYHLFHVMADDVSANATPLELIERHLPQLTPMVSALTGNSLYDLTPTRELLGFESKLTWRQFLEQ